MTAKRRAIYSTTASSISLARCTVEAQLLFDRLLTAADDQGRLQGDLLLVKSQCMPLVDKATTKNLDRWLGELETQGMVIRYEAGGQALVQIVKWWDHQDWMRHIYPSRWSAPDGWDQDRAKGNGERQPAEHLPPSDGTLPANGADNSQEARQSAALIRGGGESEDVSVSEVEASRVRDAREASDPPPPATLLDHSLSRVTTTHYDLTRKPASKGGVEMYRDLLERFGYEVVNRAQWNVGATDTADRGFIGRVKTQCQRLASQAVGA